MTSANLLCLRIRWWQFYTHAHKSYFFSCTLRWNRLCITVDSSSRLSRCRSISACWTLLVDHQRHRVCRPGILQFALVDQGQLSRRVWIGALLFRRFRGPWTVDSPRIEAWRWQRSCQWRKQGRISEVIHLKTNQNFLFFKKHSIHLAGVRLMTDWRMNRGIEEQTKAFLDGFNQVVPLVWLQFTLTSVSCDALRHAGDRHRRLAANHGLPTLLHPKL